MNIGRLSHADIPAALRLSTQAGWNQLDADWRRLIDLWPDGCFAGRIDDQLVATATLATYAPSTAWVGMVLVEEAQRGKGYGGAMMDHVITHADRRGIQSLGLDATDAGRPVYLKRGFVDHWPIERWLLPAGRKAGQMKNRAGELRPEHWPSLLALDRSATGLDRSGLLLHLRVEPGVICHGMVGDDVRVFGFRRPGRTADHIGPVVGDLGAESVIESLAGATDAAVIVDTLSDMVPEKLLYRRGFQMSRRLTRMYRRAAPALSLDNLAAAGFELG